MDPVKGTFYFSEEDIFGPYWAQFSEPVTTQFPTTTSQPLPHNYQHNLSLARENSSDDSFDSFFDSFEEKTEFPNEAFEEPEMLFDFRSIITEEEDEYEDEVVEIIDGSGEDFEENENSEKDLLKSFEIDEIVERRFQFESDDPESLLFPEFGFGLARSETISYSLDTWRYCKSCSGSSFSECSQSGTLEYCPIDSFCFIELRERRGNIVSVSSGCKARSDCQNQQELVFKGHSQVIARSNKLTYVYQ